MFLTEFTYYQISLCIQPVDALSLASVEVAANVAGDVGVDVAGAGRQSVHVLPNPTLKPGLISSTKL